MDRSACIQFSVVVTCYNKRKTIAAAVHSAREQGVGVQVIVVDDHSSDGSRELVKTLGVDDVILHPENRGALGACLTGLRAARGRFLVLLDGDDRLVPGALAALADSCLLDDDTCIKLGRCRTDAPFLPAIADRPQRVDQCLRPGWLYVALRKTGGAPYIFPRSLFSRVDEALSGNWPAIIVQDHVLPGMLGLLARRFVRMRSVGYLYTPSGSGLFARTARCARDRILSDLALYQASCGPLPQGGVTRLMLYVAMRNRMHKTALRYGTDAPPLALRAGSLPAAAQRLADHILSVTDPSLH